MFRLLRHIVQRLAGKAPNEDVNELTPVNLRGDHVAAASAHPVDITVANDDRLRPRYLQDGAVDLLDLGDNNSLERRHRFPVLPAGVYTVSEPIVQRPDGVWIMSGTFELEPLTTRPPHPPC